MAMGLGLAKGLAVTLKTMTRRSVTAHYPDVKPALPPRTRGVIALFEENCTVCMLCSRECPDWCIYIDSHKEVVPPKTPGARARTRNMLDRFAIDFALCMYCGICIEVCPFDALFWSPEFEYSEYDVRELTHEKERLREWMYTVPPPPALDPDGDRGAEFAAALKAEPKVYEATQLTAGTAYAAAPAAPAAAPAAAAPPPAAAPAQAAPAGPAQAQREHAEIAKEDVGVDQAVFDAAIAAGLPERVARGKGKSAWMKKWKADNDVAEAPPASAGEAAVQTPPADAPAAAAEDNATPSEGAPEQPQGATATEAASPAEGTHIDVGEPQIDQETYDAAIASGLPDRVARAKAKSAWVKKARKGLT
jgi:NADH-quinone oxidoreductase subunit I